MRADTGQPDPSGFGYVLMLMMPAILVSCALLGWVAGGAANWLAFLPLGIAFVIVPLLTMSGVTWDEPGPAHPRNSHTRLYYRALPLAAAPAQLATLYIATEFWSGLSLHAAGRIGWLLSIGIFGALFAITVAHELIHRRDPFDRAVGGFLLSTACFGAFKVVHLRVHHRFVGTELDFSSAQRGDSLYRFWLRCLYGNPREALRYERERQRRLGLPWWRSELLVWYGLSAFWLVLSWLLWNWAGALLLLLQSAVAILALDWTNYVQHYGLRRHLDARGRYEPVRPHHAWSMKCRITNLALLNLLRHGDHHTHPTVPYYALTHIAAPAYPYPFGVMMLLALFPPLFHRVVHPLLDRIAAKTAG
jgi:alkane 1-monooxygenase